MQESQVLDILRATFEEMTFLDVGVPNPQTVDLDIGPILFLPYSHPRAGSFCLEMPKEIKFLSAENIYGESWKDLSSEQIDDSLLELLNVLVGRFLTAHFGEQAAYVMGLPTVLYQRPFYGLNHKYYAYRFQINNIAFLLAWAEEKT
jgi:hypothetical protein